jgi:5-formyltetrahydrofolate cyclo-ligase
MSIQQLRQRMKKQRKQLSVLQQQHLSEKMVMLLSSSPFYREARNIALYLPINGEADPCQLFHQNSDIDKKFYLPVLSSCTEQPLDFIQWHSETQFKTNRYGISEPTYQAEESILATQLDLVIMPLLAFDPKGNRLGMGGGYYDRSFSFKRQAQYRYSPLLVAYAYGFQMQTQLATQAWDIPVDAYVTENQFHSL